MSYFRSALLISFLIFLEKIIIILLFLLISDIRIAFN